MTKNRVTKKVKKPKVTMIINDLEKAFKKDVKMLKEEIEFEKAQRKNKKLEEYREAKKNRN